MTAAETIQTFNDFKKKLKLIEDILTIIYPEAVIENLFIENPQKCSFTIPSSRWRYEIVWTNNFDFEIWYGLRTTRKEVKIKSSTWFKVRDLIRKRFLDAERLKWE